VTQLQNFLISAGYLGSAYNTGYYGALTDAAVKKYQLARASRAATSGGAPMSIQTASSTALPPLPAEAAYLTIGSRGQAVLNLQNILIGRGYLAVTANTGYYGPLTQAAVARYIAAYTASLAGVQYVITPVQTVTFTRTLSIGMSGQDVLFLQKFLNTHGFPVSIAGAGSPGHETVTFGPATKAAVAKFQEAYPAEILRPAGFTRGDGIMGPLTTKKILSLMSATSTER
jgi:peptidoglycan hydrolase-like protein with peptidoglycan-binding domain